MSIEELATLLGEQIMAEKADAWDEGREAGWSDVFASSGRTTSNPYRQPVNA